MRSNRYIKHYSSPRTNRRACLCEDRDTYSRKCCKGKLINQGIGEISGSVVRSYLRQEDSNLILQEDNRKIIL